MDEKFKVEIKGKEYTLKNLEDALFVVNLMQHAPEICDEDDASGYLGSAGVLLEEFEKIDPNDKGLKVLRHIFEDLKKDFLTYSTAIECGELRIDVAFDQMIVDAQKEIAASGVQRVDPNDKAALKKLNSPEFLKKLDGVQAALDNYSKVNAESSLADADIKVAYVVAPKKPSSKTIVLLSQSHDRGEETVGYRGFTMIYSQEMSRGTAAALIAYRDGFARDFYQEGLESGKIVTDGSTIKATGTFADNAPYVKLLKDPQTKGKVRVLGTENRTLVWAANRDLEKLIARDAPGDDPGYLRFHRHRALAHNVLIAHNIAQNFYEDSGEVAMFALGADHERDDTGAEHQLPIAHVLASQGFNVIVIDINAAAKKMALNPGG